MVIYIAGPMTGLPAYNRDAFMEAAALMTAAGHTVLNPAVLPTTLADHAYMPICTAMIDAADAIYLLDGWQKSIGARAERLYAKRQRKLELTEKDVNIRARQIAREERRKTDAEGQN